MSSLGSTLLLLTVIVVLLPDSAWAFGAGDIPDFSYLNEKAFRHGDIENILTEVAKSAAAAGGSAAMAGGLLGFAKNVLSGQGGSGGAKFSKSDVKKVYFGNWLRDYSQAMDIAGLQKLTAETLVLIVSILGFMTFGFATEEFEVTADRLGVYLPVEHIDNPKGYGEAEGDARQFHPKLRPPVNPEELEIDPETGMKNYMAAENRGWDTSTAHIRRTFRACIEHGRRAGGREGADLWEAYRLLGTGLHTMEDLLAHSNWCELALRKMGYEDVFCHVGDSVRIQTPNGEAPPLITGTFGSADFMHSMLGEATDHISQSSVTDLSQKMSNAQNSDGNSNIENLKNLLSKLPIGGKATDTSEAEDLSEKSKAYEFNPDDVAPPEVQQQLLELLKWRDGVYRDILSKIEMIPGLEDLIDTLTDALNAYVYTILAPWVAPILSQVTDVLSVGSKAVIDSEDQYTVFDDPEASDPSHSLLSKDHFQLILNEPAGKIAQTVVQYSVGHIVKAWADDGEDADQVINTILEAFHHPYFNTGRSQIQSAMYAGMQEWLESKLDDKDQILESLTKESVRAGKNKREGSDDETAATPGGQHASSGGTFPAQGQYTASEDYMSQGNAAGGYSGRGGSSQQSGRNNDSAQQRRYGEESERYGGAATAATGDYERRNDYESEPPRQSHGGRNEYQSSTYGEEQRGYGRQEEPSRYQRTEPERPSYGGGGGYEPSYSQPEPRQEYGGEEPRSGYGGGDGREQEEGHHRQKHHKKHHDEDEGGYDGGRGGYGGGREEPFSGGGPEGFGEERGGYQERPAGRGGREERFGEDSYGGGRNEGGYGRAPEESFGGGGGNFGRQEEDFGGRGGFGGGEPEDRGGGFGRQDAGFGGGERGGYRGGGGGGYGRQEEGFGGEQGGYRGEGGFGQGNDETFGAERLNLGGEREPEEGYGGGGGRRGGYGEESYRPEYQDRY
ncbi:Het-C-domain-containing protein [Stereum hirsutum FP-91666 SS1]|uniref:Het-C-domain-containing protein n=1 Tax=Stereum hirsutum (strain FP-91666) TaxID=721885 RepID=UPI000440D251|nr:Het-C-domain-containing protein [Stereum hirsutum FP-91666 SS1]EIM92702.1 Het-C-domain-containing protein [Stereum hirsutum FP-91666 SS1]